ncbi:CapA family protein [Paenibacillus thalictri]|uniref:CapA family protein n=1 Tax=Paenibacillus thalictri TaxID=2527873 RepID=A0A4Q9DRM6_9BACL|nr:CapA family protein [Paenibacillus thalictri]TBL79444.1 CapA family protein [Paenibacillus thalictri]
MNNAMTFVATGDSFITRRLPAERTERFAGISGLIRRAHFRFTNLEVTAHRFEGTPSALSGGTWAVAPPEVLQDIADYGFNAVAWANNHTLDYLYDGLEATAKYLDQYGFVHAGVGRNLAEASEVKYIETAAGRVALIAATSTFHDFWAAGEQRPDLAGRPGVNPLRYHANHIVSAERLELLKQIADTVHINAQQKLSKKEGFATGAETDVFMFGKHRFMAGEREGLATTPHEGDMRRMLVRIAEAKRQADYVLVSIHAHEMEADAKDKPADFLKTFARACIDGGAHAVIGHGPHIVRGIEIYKNRPIFYSLGNFIFQNDTVTHLPADFYEKYGLGHTDTISDALDKRSGNETRGLGTDPKVWSSIVPFWTMEDGELKELALYPIEMGFGQSRYSRGWPALTPDTGVLQTLQMLSAPFGTRIEIAGHIGKVIIS